MASTLKNKPAVRLADYQKHWIEDRARFKIACFSRQSGKTFASTLDIALDMQRGHSWAVLSSGWDMAIETMNELETHLRAIGVAAEAITEKYRTEDEEFLMRTVRLGNSARAVGLPSNPKTARGRSMNVYLDEFAFHDDSRKIWAALFPTITRGYRLMITSTLSGKKNKFYELWSGADNIWSRHRADIHEAVAQGLELTDPDGKPCTAEELRRALGDDDIWNEEYLLLPRDERDSWLSHDLITSCQHAQIVRTPEWATILIDAARAAHAGYRRTGSAPDDFSELVDIEAEGDLYIGMDVARKRHLSVIWIDEERDGIAHAVAVIDMHDVPFWVQNRVLDALLSHPAVRRACIDATGIGAQLAEAAQDRHGEHLVEAISFTSKSKSALAGGIRRSLEDRTRRIPECPIIRHSLHAIRKITTSTGTERFDADSDEHGHADHFWACALSESAREQSGPPPAFGHVEAEVGHYHTDRRAYLARA